MNRINIYYLLVCNIYIFKLDENFKYNFKKWEFENIWVNIYMYVFYFFIIYWVIVDNFIF